MCDINVLFCCSFALASKNIIGKILGNIMVSFHSLLLYQCYIQSGDGVCNTVENALSSP